MNLETLTYSPPVTVNAANYDPTRTTSLRNAFAREMRKRFRELRGVIRKAIVDQDCFGLRGGQSNLLFQQMRVPPSRAFDFPLSEDKIAAFMEWLREQIDRGILEVSEFPQRGMAAREAWTNMYISDSYKRGVMRARYEMQKAGFDIPSIQATGGIAASMSTPFHMDRVGLLFIRTFNDLKGITDAMSGQIARVLAQGIADGDNPMLLARKLNSIINGAGAGDLGITDTLGRFIPAERRAQMLARTEIIRAHHSATIQEYRNWGVEGVNVKAEFVTAGDERVCQECAALEGNVYTLDQAEGLIPVHVMCRCMCLPFRQSLITKKLL